MKNHEIRSKKYRRIAKWASCLSMLVLLGLFISFGIPYPLLTKDVVHCPVGEEGEAFQLVSTYRKYIHIGMFFKDVRTRSNSSDYKIYFKSPKLWRKTWVPGWLEDMSPLYAPKRYCPYFGVKKNILYMIDRGDIFLSEDGGKHFEDRMPEAVLPSGVSYRGYQHRNIGGKYYTINWYHIKTKSIIDPPRILLEKAAFVTSTKCSDKDGLFWNNNESFCDQHKSNPVLVSRVESLNLGRTWTDPVVTNQSELFQLTPIEAVPPLGDPAP